MDAPLHKYWGTCPPVPQGSTPLVAATCLRVETDEWLVATKSSLSQLVMTGITTSRHEFLVEVTADVCRVNIRRCSWSTDRRRRQESPRLHLQPSRVSSPDSFDDGKLTMPTLRPSQPTWSVSPPTVGSCRPHPPSPFIVITQPES